MCDLSKIDKPFGELTPPVQEALKAYENGGGRVQYHQQGWQWVPAGSPSWSPSFTYRADPAHYTPPTVRWRIGMPAAYRIDPFTEVNVWVKPDPEQCTYCVLSRTPTGGFRNHTTDGRWLVGVVSEFDLVPLQAKPARLPWVDWSHVGPEINHIARDWYGRVLGTARMPEVEGGIWVVTGRIWNLSGLLASYEPGDVDWQDSLISRPKLNGENDNDDQ